ncbi:hypothetical protein A1351_22740 [Methylosinus sp. R-45379]|nr:hypothetical protein A1351_22740 [Methylosinus sp. R-45379]
MDELKEAASAVECLADTGRWQTWAIAGQINVQPRIQILPKSLRDPRIRYTVEMHRHMASSRILPEHGGTEIPARITIAREVLPDEPGPKRQACQHRPIIWNTRRQPRRRDR